MIEAEINGVIIPISSICTDTAGLFTNITITEEVRIPVGLWECPRCHLYNSSFTTQCKWCSWKPGDEIK